MIYKNIQEKGIVRCMKEKQKLEDFFNKRATLGIKPGLERVMYLLEQTNHPEKKLKAVHVAGTNGKGSTIQFIQAGLVRNGYRVGIFTSPSFFGIGGHFLINGKKSLDEEIYKIMQGLLPHIDNLDKKGDGPTSFEIMTVLAFLYFKDKVDIALIETGMGGRFDTTNCFIPDVAVITNIAIDHQSFLGETTEDIAWHKAGIIKERRPIVIGKVDQGSEQVIREIAEDIKAPIYHFDQDFNYEKHQAALLFHTCFAPEKFQIPLLMKGNHQAENAAVAFMVLQLLKTQGVEMDDEKIVEGMKICTLPGRFEQIKGASNIILDSAHNVAGMKSLLATLQETFPEERKVLLFAGFRDKQLDHMLNLSDGVFDEVICTTFNHERAATLETFRQLSLLEKERFRFSEAWQSEVDSIFKDIGTNSSIYTITGSLHFITMIRSYILQNVRTE